MSGCCRSHQATVALAITGPWFAAGGGPLDVAPSPASLTGPSATCVMDAATVDAASWPADVVLPAETPDLAQLDHLPDLRRFRGRHL